MNTNNDYYDLFDTSIDEIIHTSWGPLSFEKLRPTLTSLLSMLRQMGDIINNEPNVPKPIIVTANEIFTDVNKVANSLKSFVLDTTSAGSINNRNNLEETANLVLRGYFLNESSTTTIIASKFLITYSSIISFDKKNDRLRTQFSEQFLIAEESAQDLNNKIIDAKRELTTELTSLEIVKNEYSSLLTELQQKAKEKSTEDYADIFKTEAKNNSINSVKWLIISIISFFIFILFVANEDRLLPIDPNQTSTIVTLEYIKRLLIISFSIYIITFFVKQYSIQKHLETLNKHRENTLSSYKLFIGSIGSADLDVKNSLMMEVAKAIYDSGQTGYINTKEDSNTTSSIMEITKFIKPSA